MTSSPAKGYGYSSDLNIYTKEIGGDALLTADEERSLSEAVASGDVDARNRLIQSNLRLVVKIARDYRGRGMMVDDLVGEGNLGLIRASEDFDPTFGVRFSTYAAYWIKQAILYALINTTTTIRLPAYMIGILNKLRRAENSFVNEFGREPTAAQTALSLGLTDVQLELVEKAKRARNLRLESVGGEEGRWSADQSPDRLQPIEAGLETDDECQAVLSRLEGLDTRERNIIALRFGLKGEDPKTLEETGIRIGATREWTRRLEIRALRKLDGGNALATSQKTEARRQVSA